MAPFRLRTWPTRSRQWKPIHLVGAPGEPAFENGSSNIPSSGAITFNPTGFYKDHEGIVHLQGVAKAGSSGALFTLPPGFRPAPGKALISAEVESTLFIFGGNTNLEGSEVSGKLLGSQEKPVVLDGITFRAES